MASGAWRARTEAAVIVAAWLAGGAGRLAAQSSANNVPAEGLVFERSRASVFLVETDGGTGSGFLVDASGLVLTNHHVIAGARYLAVKIAPRQKFPAHLVSSDRDRDIAVIRLNPSVVAGVLPLPLAAGRDPLVGERVLAIGNPLAQESVLTTGVVGKITFDTIISDVSINPGNSGGPLLDLEGRVIGINTFGLAEQGRGVAGIVRIHLAEPLVEQARANAAQAPAPEAEPLPVASDVPYPSAALRSLLTSKPKEKQYRLDAGKIEVQFFTPPLQHSLAVADYLKAAERKKDRAGAQDAEQKAGLYDWERHAGAYDAVVTVRAMPEVGMTGGSRIGRIFGGMMGVPTPARYRFKKDFREMRLLRAGRLVRPIVPGRVCRLFSERNEWNSLDDVGCLGLYQYPPEAFAPGAPLELHVFTEEKPSQPTVVVLKPELLGHIWSDFGPYFSALKSTSTGN